jgi:polar amino acid transport system substrate-binding protein
MAKRSFGKAQEDQAEDGAGVFLRLEAGIGTELVGSIPQALFERGGGGVFFGGGDPVHAQSTSMSSMAACRAIDSARVSSVWTAAVVAETAWPVFGETSSLGRSVRCQRPSRQGLSRLWRHAIVVGLDDNFPPMGFATKEQAGRFRHRPGARSGQAAGRRGRVQAHRLERQGSRTERQARRRLWNGLTITEERKENIAVHHAVPGKPPDHRRHRQVAIKTKADLAGKVVGVQDGSSAVEAVEKDEATAKSIKELKKYGDNVTALMDLSAPAASTRWWWTRWSAVTTPPRSRANTRARRNFGTEDYGVGTRKDDTELIAKLQKTHGRNEEGRFRRPISTKWFGKDIIKNTPVACPPTGSRLGGAACGLPRLPLSMACLRPVLVADRQ